MTQAGVRRLSLLNVTRHFGRDCVLNDITLEVERGEVLALVGPSGAGKSTLLRCINHLEVPDAGVILLDGEIVGYRERAGKLRELAPAELARQRADIGMVFQRFNLFPHLTAVENVALALRCTRGASPASAREQSQALLAGFGLGAKFHSYPGQLSGGQQQRVAIARALALQPKVMLFDEPTSALDPEFVGEVRDAMLKVATTGMTMVVVTHDIGFARQVAGRAAFLDQGKLIEVGAVDRVLQAPQSERARTFLANAS